MTKSLQTRDLEIDRLRGALVVLMVAGNYLSQISFVPAFLKHAPDIGFTIADAVAPAFVFVIGLNFGPSFSRRAQVNRAYAYMHVITRYLALLGIGALISAGSGLVGTPENWGVLQAIGVAGLVALIFIELPTWVRLGVGFSILIGYQYFLDTSMLQSVLESGHGGLFGAISWAALLILSTAIADLWRRGIAHYALGVGAGGVLAAVSTLIVPVSKNRVSLSYILLTLALSAVAFLLIKLFARLAPKSRGPLCWWGENALALYLIHLLVLAVFVTPNVDWWYVQASLGLAGLQLTASLGLLTLLALILSNRSRMRS